MAALVAAVFMSPAAESKIIDWGLKGGVNVTNLSFSKDVLASDNRSGFYVGPTVKFTIPLLGLGVDLSALYDQRSAKVADDMSVRQQQLAIPLNLRYTVGLGSKFNVFAYAGPQVGFNFNKSESSALVKSLRFKDSDFSVNVGLGVTLLSHLQVNANYNIACGKTCDITYSEVAESVFRGRFHAWQVGLAYFF